MNKIVPGPFLDGIISKFLLGPSHFKYSTNIHHAILLLDRNMNQSVIHWSIACEKQLNFQLFTCTISGFKASSGYLSMAICLAILGPILSSFKGKNFKELKEKCNKYYLDMQQYEDSNYDYELETDEYYESYFDILNDEEIEALVDYANQ